MSTPVRFTINGTQRSFAGDPMTRLLDVLRESFGLTGTKEGCGEGECGACTVLLDGEIVCSCLIPVFQADGCEIITIEGLTRDGTRDPLQEAFVAEGGAQCGACTPGMILAARALLDRDARPSREGIKEALSGTLCRCTGYERIFRAVEAVAGSRDGTSPRKPTS